MGYQQFTLAQLRALVRERLNDTSLFYRDDELDRYIRQALQVWNCLSGFWRGTQPLDPGTLVAGQHFYPVPTGWSYLLRVLVNGKPLASSSFWDLDYGRPTWESDTTATSGAPSQVSVWAPISLNLFAIWPASASGGEAIVVEGVTRAPQPTLDADYVDIGREELEAVIDEVEHLACVKVGGQEFQASIVQHQGFLKAATGRNAMLMQSSKFRQWMGLTDERKRPIRSSNEKAGAR